MTCQTRRIGKRSTMLPVYSRMVRNQAVSYWFSAANHNVFGSCPGFRLSSDWNPILYGRSAADFYRMHAEISFAVYEFPRGHGAAASGILVPDQGAIIRKTGFMVYESACKCFCRLAAVRLGPAVFIYLGSASYKRRRDVIASNSFSSAPMQRMYQIPVYTELICCSFPWILMNSVYCRKFRQEEYWSGLSSLTFWLKLNITHVKLNYQS